MVSAFVSLLNVKDKNNAKMMTAIKRGCLLKNISYAFSFVGKLIFTYAFYFDACWFFSDFDF